MRRHPDQFDNAPLDAERSVLAACLLSGEAIALAKELVLAQDFYLTAHQMMFAAILALAGRGEPADSITVTAELRRRGDLEAVGGPATIALILEYATTTANLKAHASIIVEAAARRALRRLGQDLIGRAEDPTQGVLDSLAWFEGELRRIAAMLDRAGAGVIQ